MNKKDINDLSIKILKYCGKKGYLDSIKKQKSVAESDLFDAKNINEEGLNILDAVNCVLDSKRTEFFIKEIQKKIKKNNLVLEAGIGTGILSYATAIQGAHTYGIEINQSNLKLAKKIRSYLKDKIPNYKKYLNHNPLFYYNDALKYKTDNRFDCIISENIYTGMFYEKQVQIMNHLIQFLKPEGITIPSQMISYLTLCELNPKLKSKSSLTVVNDIPKDITLPYRFLSEPIIFSDLKFSQKNLEHVNFDKNIETKENGTVNALYISADIYMPSGNMIKGTDTTFFGNDIIIPIKNQLEVEKNKKINVKINYPYSGNPKDISISMYQIQ